MKLQCAKTGRIYFPLDESLDLPSGQASVSLARRALHMGTKMSLAELQEELQVQHEVRLTDSMLDELMQRVGGVAEADRQARLEELAATPRGLERNEKVRARRAAPKRLYVSCDGITYRTRYREDDPENPGQKRLIYQEMKNGAVFWQDQKGRWCKQVVAGRDNPERFGLSLWQLAVECGLLECPEVIFISDGGAWCNSVAERYFKDARRILDWYHLREQVRNAAGDLYPADKVRAKAWTDQCLDRLHDNSGIGLLLHLQRCHAARGQKDREVLEKLMGYVRPRLAITDYVDYRAVGLVIGSGMMESTCKQVVGQRLKGPGMQWSEAGALAMTALVVQRLNGAWQSFWAGRPLQRAA